MSTQFSSLFARPLRTLAALVAVLGASGCGDGPVTPSAPPTKFLVSVSNSSPIAGTVVTITAQVADANNNALSLGTLVVLWSTGGGGVGGLSATNALTAADGTATVTLTTSAQAGITHTVTATGGGLTGTSPGITTVAGPAAKYSVSSSSTNPAAGSAVVITAQLADLNGNPVATAGRVVTWSSAGPGGSFSSPTSTTDAGGAATVNFTTSNTPGASSVSARDGNDLSGTSVSISTFLPISLVSLANGLGALHSCGIASSGAAYCWGWNGDRQLGNGGTSDSEVPGPVSGSLIMSSVSGGVLHTCGVTSDGAAYCWGDNGSGELGDNSFVNRSIPVLVAGGLSFSSVSAGASHTCGVAASGAAYCWGRNYEGQLGIGVTEATRSTPVPVNGGLTFSSVTVGGAHSCGVTTSGAAYCWGLNGSGELGDNSFTNRSVPVLVAGNLNFTSVSAGTYHTCGVTAGGAAYCWGTNSLGQLGIGVQGANRPTPLAVTGGLSFSSVAAGAAHSCGVAATGVAYCWGSNDYGELGNGTFNRSATPVAVGGGLQFRSVSAGGIEFYDYYYYGYFVDHTCGITTANVAYCWGSNDFGQLGFGRTILTSSLPRRVAGQP